MRFTIRDLLWLIVVVALVFGWMREHVIWMHRELPSPYYGEVIMDGTPIKIRHGEKMEVSIAKDGTLDWRIINGPETLNRP